MDKAERTALAEIEGELTKPHTLEAIAEKLGVSRRTVKRLEDGALRKLRNLIESDGPASDLLAFIEKNAK